jgi:hypothetical protein
MVAWELSCVVLVLERLFRTTEDEDDEYDSLVVADECRRWESNPYERKLAGF